MKLLNCPIKSIKKHEYRFETNSINIYICKVSYISVSSKAIKNCKCLVQNCSFHFWYVSYHNIAAQELSFLFWSSLPFARTQVAKMLTFVKPCGKNGHHCYQTHRPRLPHFFNGNVLKCHLVLGPDYGGDIIVSQSSRWRRPWSS